MYRCKLVLGSLLITFGLIALTSAGVQAQSGSLEPPGTAVDGSGEPVATTQTQPSWDQDLPASERFKLVLGGAAVLDNNTGLTWEQSPLAIRHSWSSALAQCLKRGTGGQMGWRLPSIHELTSLVVPGNPAGGPDLPVGHPFSSSVTPQFYWSATTSVSGPTSAWTVSFGSGTLLTQGKTAPTYVWCVRGGGPLAES